jgi:hypothetical protein
MQQPELWHDPGTRGRSDIFTLAFLALPDYY